MAPLFERTFASSPDRRVIFDDRRGWLTVAEFEAETRVLAGQLSAAGLAPGDRIVISAAATSALAVAYVGALRLGLVVVPMNPSYQAREIRYVVENARPRAVISDVSDRARLVAEASGERPIVSIGIDGATLRTRTTRGHNDLVLDRVAPGGPALLVYTSGTTGRPKGALLSHGNLLASAEALRTAWQWTPEDRLVLPLPLFHVHGLVVGLYGTLVAGGSVVVRSRFAAEDVGDAVERHSATMLFGVPTIYARLTGDQRLRSLRLCVSGSAPLPTELHRAFRKGTGQQILERYGMTETLMNTSNPYDGERRPGTVGLPLPGVELRLDESGGGSWAAGREASGGGGRGAEDEGACGEILVRGPNVFGGYWEQPAATKDTFENGWFRTGDIGTFDEAGYLRIVGRKTELVISGGFNVYPREVEDVLREHPGVADAAVVGWPHAEWGEQVVAFVEIRGGGGVTASAVTETALMTFAAGRLAPYKRPKLIRLVAELPRNALGKVVKASLTPEGGG